VTSPKLTREIIITPLPYCASCLASNCATHYLLPCEFMLGGPRNTWCTGSERGRRNAHAPVPICTAPHTHKAPSFAVYARKFGPFGTARCLFHPLFVEEVEFGLRVILTAVGDARKVKTLRG